MANVTNQPTQKRAYQGTSNSLRTRCALLGSAVFDLLGNGRCFRSSPIRIKALIRVCPYMQRYAVPFFVHFHEHLGILLGDSWVVAVKNTY